MRLACAGSEVALKKLTQVLKRFLYIDPMACLLLRTVIQAFVHKEKYQQTLATVDKHDALYIINSRQAGKVYISGITLTLPVFTVPPLNLHIKWKCCLKRGSVFYERVRIRIIRLLLLPQSNLVCGNIIVAVQD